MWTSPRYLNGSRRKTKLAKNLCGPGPILDQKLLFRSENSAALEVPSAVSTTFGC